MTLVAEQYHNQMKINKCVKCGRDVITTQECDDKIHYACAYPQKKRTR